MGEIVRVVCCTMCKVLDVRMRKKVSKENRSIRKDDSLFRISNGQSLPPLNFPATSAVSTIHKILVGEAYRGRKGGAE
jgi:hypothetical protein